MLFPHNTLNCRGSILDISEPLVMGILNLTPDSFFDGGAYKTRDQIHRKIDEMIAAGAIIIDVGGMSSRPGAEVVDPAEEIRRIVPAFAYLNSKYSDIFISVDSFQPTVVEAALDMGAHIINDISGFRSDFKIPALAKENNCPYILMHMQGNPKTMQSNPSYENVALEILDFFIERIGVLREADLVDIIIDPGFGFGKSVYDNYKLLSSLHVFQMLEFPIMAGLSRKSMIYKLLELTAEQSLPATSALHMVALQQGARILRAHDVREAKQCIELWKMTV